ncbi:unnamed protein product [Arabidopsis thaliana]|uniref:Uncharacterized protein n=1 Tax=Arabidopsis thaliana TaxID=3702 RepID=A0A654FC92_ARATH|nr:unnamed protein product [Arabidopsis thaliana]
MATLTRMKNGTNLDTKERYLGTVRESDSLNIMMQFVPGGSMNCSWWINFIFVGEVWIFS